MVKSRLTQINPELLKIPLLKALCEVPCLDLHQSALERSYRKKECIYTPEKNGDYILIVIKGKVRIISAILMVRSSLLPS